MRKLTFVFLWLMAFSAVGRDYLNNGSFEVGMHTGWEYEVTGISKAAFSLEQSAKVMDGSVALRVDVTAVASSKPNSIKATTRFTAGNDSIYLLRFWARGAEESRVYVEVEGSESPGILFQVHSGETLFHLPFKFDTTKENKELAINFYFRDYRGKLKTRTPRDCKVSTIEATYYLDGVEVLDQSNKQHIDVVQQYNWNYRQKAGLGWVAGDNDVSLQLPDGRTIWFFNDSFYATNHPEQNRLNDWGSFVRNACVVEEADGTLVTRPVTDQGGQRVYFEIPNDQLIKEGNNVRNFFWVGDAIMEDGQVKVHLIECNTVKNPESGADEVVNTDRSYLGIFSYPELEYLGLERQEDFCARFETFFVDDADNKIYLYRSEEEDKDDSWNWNRHTYVARADLGDLSGKKGTWEFWDGTAWSANRADVDTLAGRTINMMADAVIKLGQGSYAQVSMPVMSHDVTVSFAPAPQGPWTPKQTIYSATNDSSSWYYMPNFHGQLPNGNYSISFSANYGYCLFMCAECDHWAFVDKYWYRPRYIQFDLLALSPYSEKKDCAGVANGTAYLDECEECVGGTTGKEPCLPPTPPQREGITGLAGVYAIQNKQSGLYMSIQNQSAENHALVIQSEYAGSQSQQFELNDLGDGYYNIINVASGLLISPVNLSEDAKANIEQWNGLNYLDITDFEGGQLSAQYEAASASEDVGKLIDNNRITKYSVSQGRAWVQFHSATPQIVTRYVLMASNNAPLRDPKNWSLYGSNDGEIWTKLDTVSGFKFQSRFEEKYRNIDNETAYSYYRLNMECYSGNALQLAEWKLLIGIAPEAGADNQKFLIQDAGEGYVKFFNKHSNLALEVLDGFTYAEANVWQIPDVGQYGTLWKLIGNVAIKDVETTGKPEIIVYPNPVRQQANIKLPAEWQNCNFFIHNINGSLVYSGKVSDASFDLGRLPSGYYLIKVRKNDDVLVNRFVKY